MGSCLSANFTGEVIDFPPTAKVIAIDGSLIEYSVPANVAQILGRDYSTSFLCNSDELDFDKRIPALGSHDLVELDQIYFVLPRSMCDQLLRGADMAALAVKASLALEKRTTIRDGKRSRVLPIRELNESSTETFEAIDDFKMFGLSRNVDFQWSTKGFARRAVVRGRNQVPRLSIIKE